MTIGIDLDNTLIDYSQCLLTAGKRLGVLPQDFEGSKEAVRSFLRAQDSTGSKRGEGLWQRLQFEVYAYEILSAPMYEGALDFIRHALEQGKSVVIISHKTAYATQDIACEMNLQQQAMKWIETRLNAHLNGYFQLGKNVFFAETQLTKIQQISTWGCERFIDDLVEVLQHEDFPEGVKRYWFCPSSDGKNKDLDQNIRRVTHWQTLCQML